MEIIEQLQEIAVKINCIDFAGSGFLIQPATSTCTYVITAKHCLEGTEEEKQEYSNEDIIIKRWKAKAEDIKLTVLGCYPHKTKDIDLAIIAVEYIENLPPIYISKPKFLEDCFIYGYPRLLEGMDNPRELLIGKISDLGSEIDKMEVKIQGKQESIGSSTAINIVGFSGSVVCGNEFGNLRVYGVFSELKDKTAAHNTYCGFNTKSLEELIISYGIEPLINYKLTTFDCYIDKAFDRYQDNVKIILKNKFREMNQAIPYDIVQQVGKKLLIPYGEQYILSDELWCGWTKLLIFLQITNIETGNIQDIFYPQPYKDNQIRFFYSEVHERSEDIISNIFRNKEIRDDINNNDIIFMNSKSIPNDKFWGKKRIGNIIKKIDCEYRYNNGIDITNADCTKNICGIHIELFGDKFHEKVNDEIDVFFVEEEIKRVILEVLDDAIC